MICVKLARIACGDATERDHWRDIAGYATLAQHYIEDMICAEAQAKLDAHEQKQKDGA
jgi:hypothetical protein